MMAFAYPMSITEIIFWDNPKVIENLNNWDILHGDTLMVYPEQDEHKQGTIVETVLVDGANKTYTMIAQGEDEWHVFVHSNEFDIHGNISRIREWEYTSIGGHDPKWHLWSYYVNGEPQEIIRL